MSELMLNNLIMYPRAVLRSSFIILCNIYCIPTYVVWMTLLLPVKRYNTDLYYRIESILYHWIISVVSLWSYSAGYDVVEVGDDISPCQKKRTLVIANHQSTADVPLMMACFNVKQDVLPNLMWIMDRLFKYTNFGIVSLIHQDFFITSGRSSRDTSLIQFRKHIEESFLPRCRKWMVLFPEGGFLHKRKEVSQRFAQKNNLPELNNVTLPRVGALKTAFAVLPPHNYTATLAANNNSQLKSQQLTPPASPTASPTATSVSSASSAPASSPTSVSSLPKENGQITEENVYQSNDLMNNVSDESLLCDKHIDYVLDITIAYPEGKPLDLPTIVHGLRKSCRTHFFYRLYKTSEVPGDEEALTKWLYDRWVEKEEILKYFYRNGHFEHFTSNTPAVVQQDMLRHLIINLFFITSSYVHLQMVFMLASYWNDLYVYTFM